MANKRYSVEQIVAKLREGEKLQGRGLTIPQACKRLGISEQTFYRWRTKYGARRAASSTRQSWRCFSRTTRTSARSLAGAWRRPC